ncbi:MAG TPA: Wzz/FepE/Etk N-terminal domain-containing protein [Acidimicrobiales bacterium]|nr:Wzz/FepE/Etk N-terminal domain-containing protein [Acidimicrobiales bacterium]
MRSIVKYQAKTDDDVIPDRLLAPGDTPPRGQRALTDEDLAREDQAREDLAREEEARARQRSGGYESIGRSALGHPWLVGLLTLLGLLAGAAVGYVHPPSYTANAQLIVGRTSGLVEDEVPGLQAAVQGLAEDYARLITASNVQAQTLANLHSSSLGGTLSATEIPLSSIIQVQATASTQTQAVQLAQAGASALDTVVVQITNDTPSDLKPIVNEFESADAAYEKANVQVTLFQSQLNALEAKIGSGNPTPTELAEQQSLNTEIAAWQTQADTARMQAQVYQNQYNSAVPPLATQQEMVQQVGAATSAGSNRKTFMEAGALGGAVGGLLIGLAAACLVDARKGRSGRTAEAQY